MNRNIRMTGNNDGNIGDVITAVIGDNGSIGLYQTGSGSYLIDNSGLGIGDYR